MTDAAQAQEADQKADEVAVAPAPAPTTKAVRAIVLVGGGTLPKGYDMAIVTETVAVDADGVLVGKNTGFPSGADAYLRYSPDLKFPAKDDRVFTMGDNLKQHNFAGFTRVAGFVNVGPAHPAFAAANLAYQRGATNIDIIGLTGGEKERLQVWFDALAADPVEPAQVAINLS